MIALNVSYKTFPTAQTLLSKEQHFHKHGTESGTQNTVFMYFYASKSLTLDLY